MPLIRKKSHSVSVGRFKVGWVQLVEDKPRSIRANPRWNQGILLSDHYNRYCTVEYDMPSVHDQLCEPRVELCFLHLPNNIVEYYQHVSVRPLLFDFWHLLEIIELLLKKLRLLLLFLFTLSVLLSLICAVYSHRTG